MSSRPRLLSWVHAQKLGSLAHLHPAITSRISANKGESSRQGASNQEREGWCRCSAGWGIPLPTQPKAEVRPVGGAVVPPQQSPPPDTAGL